MKFSAQKLFLLTHSLLKNCLGIFLGATLLGSTFSYAADEHDHNHNDGHGDEHSTPKKETAKHGHDDEHEHGGHGHDEHEEEKNHVELTNDSATQSGLTTAIAEAGEVHQRIALYGQIIAKPENVRQLSARFPGIIRTMNVQQGSRVQKGDVLASIEANDSLRSYNIVAPINGVVIARHANDGEATGDKPLLTIANFSQLMAKLSAFPRDAAQLEIDQPVLINSRNKTRSAHSHIETLTPSSDNSPTMTLLLELNDSSHQWTPGEWINAYVTVSKKSVALRIDQRAVQTVREQNAVFVKNGERYELRPVKLGDSDGEFTEVLSGLNSGERYVVGNSYLLKADLEKSGAAHEH